MRDMVRLLRIAQELVESAEVTGLAYGVRVDSELLAELEEEIKAIDAEAREALRKLPLADELMRDEPRVYTRDPERRSVVDPEAS